MKIIFKQFNRFLFLTTLLLVFFVLSGCAWQNKKKEVENIQPPIFVDQYTVDQETDQPLVAPDNNIVVDSNVDVSGAQKKDPTSPISILFKDFKCEQNNSYAQFDIFRNEKFIKTIKASSCESNESVILAKNDKKVFFSILPGGIGGYILYSKYANLYSFDLIDNSVDVVLEDGGFYGLDFTPAVDYLVYDFQNKIIIRNLTDNSKKEYEVPMNTDNMQFGSFKFSPQSDKVAFAVGYGPDNEHGEIYILNLKNSKFVLYKETDNPPVVEKWIDNTIVDINMGYNIYDQFHDLENYLVKNNIPNDCQDELDVKCWYIYKNKELGFEIKVPPSWNKYKIKITKTDDNLISVSFLKQLKFPEKQPYNDDFFMLLSISVVSEAWWKEELSYNQPHPGLFGIKNNKAFIYGALQDGTQQDHNEVQGVIKTFKLIN